MNLPPSPSHPPPGPGPRPGDEHLAGYGPPPGPAPGDPGAPPPPAGWQSAGGGAAPPPRSNLLIALVVMLAVVAVGGAGVLLVRNNGDNGDTTTGTTVPPTPETTAAPPPAPDPPEEVLADFMNALAADDCQRAFGHLSTRDLDDLGTGYAGAVEECEGYVQEEPGQLVPVNFEIIDVTSESVSDTEAQVTLESWMDQEGGDRARDTTYFTMYLEDGAWVIPCDHEVGFYCPGDDGDSEAGDDGAPPSPEDLEDEMGLNDD